MRIFVNDVKISVYSAKDWEEFVMMKEKIKAFSPLLLCLCFGLSACGSYGTHNTYLQDLVHDTKDTFTLSNKVLDQDAFLRERPKLHEVPADKLAYLPQPLTSQQARVIAVVQRPSGAMSPQALILPPAYLLQPAATAPIGDKGMSEAEKELLRRKNPNLTPSKKPWLPSGK